MIEKRKFVCYGCGKDRPCFVQSNQENRGFTDPIEDLKCILDETNQTGYKWGYYSPTSDNRLKSIMAKWLSELESDKELKKFYENSSVLQDVIAAILPLTDVL